MLIEIKRKNLGAPVHIFALSCDIMAKNTETY